MPSATVHSALVEMQLGDGLPWNFSQWQKITGVTHGLFPTDDAQLPKGWTRKTASLVASYFSQFNNQPNPLAKLRFASARRGAISVPGRDIWRTWVTARWREWAIHAKITNLLSSQNLHPLTISLNSKSKSLSWPKAGTYVALCIDAVGQMLFGDDVLDMFGRLPEEMRSDVNALVTRTWFYLRIQFERNKVRIVKLENQATEAFQSLDQEKPTKTKIKAVIVKVARWRNLAQVLRSKDNMEKMESMDAALVELMIGIGAKLSTAATEPKTKYVKVTRQALQTLASEEDVADVVNLYTTFFTGHDPEDSVNLCEQVPDVSFRFGEIVDGADPGVEMEISLSLDELDHNLGFVNGGPILFNQYRHRAGLSSWDPANTHLYEAKNAETNADMEKITLHWHQKAGVHAFVRMMFKPNADPNALNGCLVADEVGLGKTFQAITTIAFLSDLVMREEMGEKPPPIIESNPYLGESTKVPDLPHLILVPGTLLSQWEVEIKVLLRPKSFDVMKYETGKGVHEKFWGPDGEFRKSNQKPRHKIILASHSAFHKDAASLFMWVKPGPGQLPWVSARRLPSYETQVGNTLWGQEYLSITLDEAHLYRNSSARHAYIIDLLSRAKVRNIMSATPVQTSTKDIAGMGRLVNIPYFSSEDAFAEEKSDMSTIRKSKASDPDAPVDEDSVDCLILIAQRMQRQFEGRILRRTIDSVDWRGERLIDIPPYEEIIVVLKLTTREMDIISERSNSVKESASASNGHLQIMSYGFYLEHRMSVSFAREDLSITAPTFETLEAWDLMKSTKYDTFARMCRHIFTRDDAPPMAFEDGKVIYPDMPPLVPGQILSKKVKVIGYLEFPFLSPLLRNVLDLYGVKYLYIDGGTPFLQRAQIVKRFCEGFTHRLIIISSVGAIGLNLSVASQIIFIDQPWSAQDERQVRGRAHRQPQKEIVKCYHLLADETADIVLSSLARGKKTMFDAFLEKESGQEMYQLLSGKHVGQPEDDCDEEDDFEVMDEKRITKRQKKAEKKKSKKAKKAAAKANAQVQVTADDLSDDIEVDDATEKAPKKKKSKKARRAAAKAKAKVLAAADDPADDSADDPADGVEMDETVENEPEETKKADLAGDVEMGDATQAQELPPAPMDVDKRRPVQPVQPQLMDIDDNDSTATHDHTNGPPGNDDELGGATSDGDGFRGPASVPPSDDDEEPSGANSDEDDPNDDDDDDDTYNNSTGTHQSPSNRSSSPDLSFLFSDNAKSPVAGDRRPRDLLPDSPEVLKEPKRSRMVDYSSSPAGSFGGDVEMGAGIQADSAPGDKNSPRSQPTQPAVDPQNYSLEQRAPRPMVIRRSLAPGFIRDRDAPPFKAPASFLPAPPFALPAKEPPREPAPLGRNPMRPAMITASHRRSKSSATLSATSRIHHDNFIKHMNAVRPTDGEDSQGSGSSLLPSAALTPDSAAAPSVPPFNPLTARNPLTAHNPLNPLTAHRRVSSTSAIPRIRQPLQFGRAPGERRGVSPPAATTQSKNPYASGRRHKTRK